MKETTVNLWLVLIAGICVGFMIGLLVATSVIHADQNSVPDWVYTP